MDPTSQNWIDTPLTRTIHVIHDGEDIGRIYEMASSPEHATDEKYVIEVRDPYYSYYDRVSVAQTILHAKKFAEKELPERFFERIKRNRLYDKPPRLTVARIAALPAGCGDDFYPTPYALAGRMFSHVNWDDIESILEPSAGKGDLLDALLRFAHDHQYDNHYNSRVPQNKRKLGKSPEEVVRLVDAIELDTNLRALLTGKGYRVVSDDFLEFTTHKKYDLFLMNPPFSEGAAHLMKAISLAKEHGGQIVCLLNANTIRNPYTNERKALLKELACYGAKFEYVKNGFKKAERPTDVETVIVSLTVPAPPVRSRILEYLQKAPAYTGENDATALAVKGDWIHAMLQYYKFEADAGVRILREYQGYANFRLYPGDPVIMFAIGDRRNTTSEVTTETINAFLKELRTLYWKRLMHSPDLQKVVGKLTSNMLNEYESKVSQMADYEFSEFNIRSLVLDMQAQLNQGLKDALLDLFDTLSGKHSWFPESKNTIHYYNGWKTNQAHKVGMKAILPINGVTAAKWKTEKLDEYKIVAKLNDLERVMDFLDRGQTTFHNSLTLSVRKANESSQKFPIVEATYFDAKFYAKGTCHIKFHEDARHIIDRLNIYAAMQRNWLPPYYGKVRYEDMDDEGKAAVDAFHAESESEAGGKYMPPSYDEVCKAPGNYLTTMSNNLPLLGLGTADAEESA